MNITKKIKNGFTIVELLIGLVIVGILTAIALPQYSDNIIKTKARGAGSDLISLSLILENQNQLQLSYPVYSTSTTITTTNFPKFNPNQSADFTYKIISTANTYTLTATGKNQLLNCNLTLKENNSKTTTSSCKISSW